MRHIIAVSTNTYHGFTVDQALEGIAAAGFKHVELTAVRGWTEHVMPDRGEAELLRIKGRLAELGLNCIALSGHCNLTDEARLNDFRANMKLAAFFGAKWIISSTGEAHFGKEESFTDEVLVRNIRSLLPDLEANKLQLGIEVHGEYGTGEAVGRVVAGVASPLVGINYDTANVVFYGGKNPVDEIKTCAGSVNYIHLKDKVGLDKSWNFPAIGKGDLDLPAVVAYAGAHGYTGPLSVEIEFTADFTMREKKPGDIDTVNAALKDSFSHLKAVGLI